MPIEAGSDLWKLRELNSTGNPAIYTSKTLLEEFRNYYTWMMDNPLFKTVLTNKGELANIPLMRPMSIKGFCIFAGIAQNTFYGYANNPDYFAACELIKDVVFTQKFEGASVGLFNALIMSRDLGLSDTISHVVDDRRKSVSELFPNEEEILSIEAEETSADDIKAINLQNNGSTDQ